MDCERTAEIARQEAERFERADRYLDRVATLTPTDWGRLDAVGAQLQARDPLAVWRRARRFARELSPSPALEGPMIVGHLGVEIARGLLHALDGDRGLPQLTQWLARLTLRGRPISPEARQTSARFGAQMRRLHDIAASQPGGAGAAVVCLGAGLLALHAGDKRSHGATGGIYALVEPFIPFASL